MKVIQGVMKGVIVVVVLLFVMEGSEGGAVVNGDIPGIEVRV